MDTNNCIAPGEVKDEAEKEITSTTDHSSSQKSAQLGIDVEKATGNEPDKDDNVVDWDGPQDPQNPQNWRKTKKWTIIILVSAITFNQYAFPAPITSP